MAVIRSVTNIAAFRNGMNAENCGSGVAANGATIPSATIKTATAAFADQICLGVGGKFIKPTIGASNWLTVGLFKVTPASGLMRVIMFIAGVSLSVAVSLSV